MIAREIVPPAPRRRLTGCRPALVLLGLALAGTDAAAQVPAPTAASCIATHNRAVAQVLSGAEQRLLADCLERVRDASGADLERCLNADPSGIRASAAARFGRRQQARCSEPPPWGWAEGELATSGARLATEALAAELFAGTAGGTGGARTAWRCRRAGMRALRARVRTNLESFVTCTQSSLAIGGLIDAADLETTCFDAVIADPHRRRARIQERLRRLLPRRCARVPAAEVFAGACAQAADPADCLMARADCNACRLVNEADDLQRECDLFDDGSRNDSCSTCGNARLETGENCDDGVANGSGCCSIQCRDLCATP